MSTSGSWDWSLTGQYIISEALEDLGVIVPGGTPATVIQTSALAVLNRITKSWATKGIRVWAIDWKTKTFSAPSEVTGTDSEVYTCIRCHTSAATSAPITGADYSTYWYKTGETGGVWATSTSYTTPGDFDVDVQVLDIVRASIRYNDEDTPLEIITMDQYFDISDKWRDGKPAYLAFDKANTGHVYLYPQPDFEDYADYVLHYLAALKLEDFDAVGNDADMSNIYLDALVKALKAAIAPKFKISLQDRVLMKAEAKEAFDFLKRTEAPAPTSRTITPAFTLR